MSRYVSRFNANEEKVLENLSARYKVYFCEKSTFVPRTHSQISSSRCTRTDEWRKSSEKSVRDRFETLKLKWQIWTSLRRREGGGAGLLSRAKHKWHLEILSSLLYLGEFPFNRLNLGEIKVKARDPARALLVSWNKSAPFGARTKNKFDIRVFLPLASNWNSITVLISSDLPPSKWSLFWISPQSPRRTFDVALHSFMLNHLAFEARGEIFHQVRRVIRLRAN